MEVVRGHEQLMAAIMAGLVIGKPLGLLAASALAVWLKLAVKPNDYSWRQLLGAGALAGIGFTMSLFIASQAFPAANDFAAAKIAVFAASIALGADRRGDPLECPVPARCRRRRRRDPRAGIEKGRAGLARRPSSSSVCVIAAAASQPAATPREAARPAAKSLGRRRSRLLLAAALIGRQADKSDRAGRRDHRKICAW